RTTGFGGLYALAIQHGGAGGGLSTGTFAVQHEQMVIYRLPSTIVAEADEPGIGRLVRRKMLGQHAPRAAAAQHKENGVDDFSHGPAALSSGLGWWRKQRFQDRPFGVGQVAGIAQVVPVVV